MNKKIKPQIYSKTIYPLIILFMIGFVLAVSWTGYDVNYQGFEDNLYTHNLSANISDPTSDMSFAVDTVQTNITWNGIKIEYTDVSHWMYIIDSNNGTFIINATTDNQTGLFIIPFKVTWGSGPSSGILFNFTINATNDAPNFTLDSTYNTSVTSFTNSSILVNITGSDEELQYPLILHNITFLNCANALWSTRDGNCNLNFTNSSDSNIVAINFTNLSRNDVGQYNISICLNDTINQSDLPTYRDATYNQSKTTCMDTILNIEQALTIDASNCGSNQVLQENAPFTCQINVTTRRQSDNLITWSNATLRSNGANAINSSWFYSLNNSNSADFMQTYNITLTPGKREIGNWTINFSATDTTTNEISSDIIYIYVNRTTNSVPAISIIPLPENSTSINMNTIIYMTSHDNDFLIQDKVDGFNETSNITIMFYNRTDRTNATGLSYTFSKTQTPNTNITTGTITFNAGTALSGNYTLNITVLDKESATDNQEYNFTILSKSFPQWNQTSYVFNIKVNSTINTTQNFFLNLSTYVNDTDNSAMSFTASTNFSSLNMTTDGIINFAPYKQDIGYYSINITASNRYLTNYSTFYFNITNINSIPNISHLQGSGYDYSSTGAEILSEATVNTSESSQLTFRLVINDDDLTINPAYYVENLSITTSTINSTGTNLGLFNFTEWESCELCTASNQTGFIASFTPAKSQVGQYNISITIMDLNSSSVQRNFTLNILETNNAPLLSNLTNQTYKINSSFYYRINATDIEDGNSLNEGNLTFGYNFLEGTDFFNTTTFNNTTGEISLYLNESMGGKYKINITVTDSGIAGTENLSDSDTFWINIYDLPNITLPSSGETFNTSENSTYNFTFTINHSVGDSLNYSFYLNSVLLNRSLNICNGTNKTFYFTPNFTQEGYGNYSNLTLFVFSPLYPELNSTGTWNFNITHVNYPLENYTSIANQSGASTITLNLKDYFRDIDADDNAINQTIAFEYTLINITSGEIPAITINNWTNGSPTNITFSSTSSSSGIYNISAYEYNESNNSQIIKNITSNNFYINLNVETIAITTPVTSSGGGGGSTITNTIKLLAVSETSINNNGHIEFKFEVLNTGKSVLNNINLTNIIQKEISQEINTTFSKNTITSLAPGSSEKISLFMDIDTKKEGKYTLILFANVSSPKISDWAEVYLNIIQSNESEAEKMIVFTEKLIIENPECLELNEIFKEAKKLFESGDYSKSIETSEKIVESCKNTISKNSQIKTKNPFENNYVNYLSFIIVTLIIFFIYFVYQRARFKNKYLLKQ